MRLQVGRLTHQVVCVRPHFRGACAKCLEKRMYVVALRVLPRSRKSFRICWSFHFRLLFGIEASLGRLACHAMVVDQLARRHRQTGPGMFSASYLVGMFKIISRLRPKFRRFRWPRLAQCSPILPELGGLGQLGPKFHQIWPTFLDTEPLSATHRPSFAKFGQNWATRPNID